MEIRLGKLPAEHDPQNRTIKFKAVLNELALPKLPDEWEFRKQYPQFDLSPRMWRNGGKNGLPNCVEVASYAQQREFEVIEQGKVIDVDEGQLVSQYQKEAGGDYGLTMLDHMKVWKNDGLPIGYGKKLLCLKRPLMHKIDAFARVNPQNPTEIKYAMFLLGCNIGASMPDTYQYEFAAGKPWADTSLPPNPENGHAMKLMGWTPEHAILWTWGVEQLATWDWIVKYCDEVWTMIDCIDEWLPTSPINVDKLREFLDIISKL
jgi:hypothetical protein